jgi:hypothetical protein
MLPSSKIAFREFLQHSNPVRMKVEVIMKNLPHKTIRHSKGRSQKRLLYRLDVLG